MMKSLYTVRSARLLYSLPLILLAGCGSPETRAQDYYDKGMALIAKHDDLGSRVQRLSSVKYKSDNVEVWRALAGVDERTKGPSYFQDLRRIVELDGNDLDARLKLARIVLAGGAGEAALKVIDAANEGDRPNAALHALKAMILAKTNDVSGAVHEAQRALEIDPKNVEASVLMAAKKLSDGDAAGALQLLNSVPADPKYDTQITLLKIQAFARRNDLPQAGTLLQGLIAQHPDERAYRNQLIQLYIAQKRFDDAEKELRSTASASPTDSKPVLELVRFLISVKGAAAGRDELAARIKAGGDV